jgi:hypothetical protein
MHDKPNVALIERVSPEWIGLTMQFLSSVAQGLTALRI